MASIVTKTKIQETIYQIFPQTWEDSECIKRYGYRVYAIRNGKINDEAERIQKIEFSEYGDLILYKDDKVFHVSPGLIQ
jgi:hypothetical protein